MKKTVLVLLMTLSASAAFSKQLTVVCEKQNPNLANIAGAALSAVMEIENVNAVPVIQNFTAQGRQVQAKLAASKITKDSASLKFQFGQSLWSSASIELQDCTDSFSATGAATMDIYVGGFAGTARQALTCTCELK
jgi:hypothetical protein